MDFTKEVVLPVALSKVLGRIFSFLFDSLSRPAVAGARDVHRRRLERLLSNIGTMVEEAEGRHITNVQLLSHLKALTDGMFRGRFALEVTDLDDINNTGDDDDGDEGGDDVRRRSFALCSSFNRAKRSRVTSLIFGGNGSGDDGTERLAAVVDELESLMSDYMREFILMVQGYPRKVHRPVRTTLYMDRCVFGRHVEKERIVDFLLQRPPAGAPYLSVLAVVGGKKVGKTTLVKHACDDELVRDHFARIEWFETPDVVREAGLPGQTVWESDGPEYLAGVRRIIASQRFSSARSLLVFEDAWPIDEAAWSELASTPSATTTTLAAAGTKLLFTCRDADLARLGTVEPVVLRHLPPEEYWYYFMAFAFGGADPREHPRIAAVGREISEHLERTFLESRVLGTLLRANFDARFWRRVLAAIVGAPAGRCTSACCSSSCRCTASCSRTGTVGAPPSSRCKTCSAPAPAAVAGRCRRKGSPSTSAGRRCTWITGTASLSTTTTPPPPELRLAVPCRQPLRPIYCRFGGPYIEDLEAHYACTEIEMVGG